MAKQTKIKKRRAKSRAKAAAAAATAAAALAAAAVNADENPNDTNVPPPAEAHTSTDACATSNAWARGCACLANSNFFLPPLPAASTPNSDLHNDFCERCGLGGEVVCCGKCNLVFHYDCHLPKLNNVSMEEGNWRCGFCISVDESISKEE